MTYDLIGTKRIVMFEDTENTYVVTQSLVVKGRHLETKVRSYNRIDPTKNETLIVESKHDLLYRSDAPLAKIVRHAVLTEKLFGLI
jgi:hypothetical protein